MLPLHEGCKVGDLDFPARTATMRSTRFLPLGRYEEPSAPREGWQAFEGCHKGRRFTTFPTRLDPANGGNTKCSGVKQLMRTR